MQPEEILALSRIVAHERLDFISWGIKSAQAMCPKIIICNIIGTGMFGYVYLAREVHFRLHVPLNDRPLALTCVCILQAVSSDQVYALKIFPMSRDDYLSTWASRLRMLPMFRHSNVIRYLPAEWHYRGRQHRRSVSYSAVYLAMDFCNRGRYPWLRNRLSEMRISCCLRQPLPPLAA
jgi:serine/threonine protein kinase